MRRVDGRGGSKRVVVRSEYLARVSGRVELASTATRDDLLIGRSSGRRGLPERRGSRLKAKPRSCKSRGLWENCKVNGVRRSTILWVRNGRRNRSSVTSALVTT